MATATQSNGKTTRTRENTENTKSWPDLAIGLYDKLTGRGAEITYEFDNMEVWVPSGAEGNVSSAPWKLNGVLRIRTRDDVNGGAEE